MKTSSEREIVVETLVVGSGLAGLLLALELSRQGITVLLACKGALADSNTSFAQGGLAAVTAEQPPKPAPPADSPELHVRDTIKSGAGLTDPLIASLIVREGATLIDRLNELGVRFDKTASGTLEPALEGGHSHPRVIHSKDTTGGAISSGLIEQIRRDRKITVLENAFALDLVTTDGQCTAAWLVTAGRRLLVRAGQVVLAAGGAGQVFERTTNPGVATGDGIAIAWRAGASLVDMEFVQFHPTALAKDGAPAFLISEAARGAGAVLLDRHGRRFVERFHPDGELATRDVVTRAITTVMSEQDLDHVWLDLRPIGVDAVVERFPSILRTLRKCGIDPLDEPVPIAPAAHYMMGGIWTNANGLTSLPGLYAIGECASTGLHGANRLASNSLLEAGVMALRCARHIVNHKLTPSAIRKGEACRARTDMAPAPRAMPADLGMLRHLFYRYAGVERSETGLLKLFECLSELSVIGEPETIAEAEAANMLAVGELIALSAMSRRESRGAHWRTDFPNRDDNNYGCRIHLNRNEVDAAYESAESPTINAGIT